MTFIQLVQRLILIYLPEFGSLGTNYRMQADLDANIRSMRIPRASAFSANKQQRPNITYFDEDNRRQPGFQPGFVGQNTERRVRV